jgi:lipoprotein signal peptidase
MTSLDRTPVGTEHSAARLYAWLAFLTVLAILATVLLLAFTGNEEAAVAVATGGLAAGAIGGVMRITIHVRR